MIARLWRGRTAAARAEDYRRYLLDTGVADYRATPGNAGVWLMQRTLGDAVEFMLLTHWRSREAIVAFAGDDIARARYYARDAEFLIALEPQVEHYEVEVFGG